MPFTIDRRDFLGAAALAAAFPGRSAAAPAPEAEGWFSRPMRWAQLTLVENDPGQYDLSFWLDYFQRTHSDAACLSAGGCVAFYPTAIPLHYRSQWLGDRDRFGDLVAGCRKLDMVRDRAHRSPRRSSGRLRRPSRLDRRRGQRPEAPPLGHARTVGHLRARTV